MMNEINDKMSEAFAHRDFATRKKYDEIAEAIYEYEQKLEQLMSLLEVDEVVEAAKYDIDNLIIKLLREYCYRTNDYKVYLRAGYSGLNRN